MSEQEQQELLTQLEEYLVLGSQVAQVTKEVKEIRFSKGRVCCHLLILIKELNLLICQDLLVREGNKSRKEVLVKSKCVWVLLLIDKEI